MSTDEERIEEELSTLTNEHMAFLRRELEIQFLHQADDLEYRFSTLPINVCIGCGKEYRITHICELTNRREWKPGWKNDMLALFESQMKVK